MSKTQININLRKVIGWIGLIFVAYIYVMDWVLKYNRERAIKLGALGGLLFMMWFFFEQFIFDKTEKGGKTWKKTVKI